MATSVEKLDAVIAGAREVDPGDEAGARIAQAIQGAGPFVKNIVPQDPAELDKYLIGTAEFLLNLRSDDAADVAVAPAQAPTPTQPGPDGPDPAPSDPTVSGPAVPEPVPGAPLPVTEPTPPAEPAPPDPTPAPQAPPVPPPAPQGGDQGGPVETG